MPSSLTSLTDIDNRIMSEENQCQTVDDLYSFLFRQDIPKETIQDILRYAKEHGFSIAKDGTTDLYLLANNENRLMKFVRWSGIERVCRRTKLWMPGKTDIKQVANDVYVVASCYARLDQQSPWNEVQTFVGLASFTNRDLRNIVSKDNKVDPKITTQSDLIKALKDAPRLGREWYGTPDVILNEIGQYHAALKVFGDFIGQHSYAYMMPRFDALLEYVESLAKA